MDILDLDTPDLGITGLDIQNLDNPDLGSTRCVHGREGSAWEGERMGGHREGEV